MRICAKPNLGVKIQRMQASPSIVKIEDFRLKFPNIKDSTQAQGPETIQEVKSKLEIKEEAKSETKTKRVRRKARSTGSRETEEELPDEARETPSEKETGVRPRREKVRSSMSEIERAKIKNSSINPTKLQTHFATVYCVEKNN